MTVPKNEPHPVTLSPCHLVTLSSARRLALAILGLLLLGAAAVYHYRTTAPDYLLARGKRALDRGDVDEAWHLVERLEHDHEGHSLLLRGECWLVLAQASDEVRPVSSAEALRNALYALGRIQMEGPVGMEAAVRAGECLVRLGKHRAAADILNRVVQRDPDQRDAHRWLAAVYIDLSSPTEAIRHLTEWGRLAPEEGRPYRWIGFFHKDYQHPEAAIAAYREALARRLEPELRADVVRELAESLLDARADYQGVLDTLEQCPSDYANSPDLRLYRAESLWGLGRLHEAEKLADEVLATDPNYPRGLRVRARMYVATDQPRLGRPLLEKCVAQTPLDVSARQSLLEVCQQLQDDEAVRTHRQKYEEGRDLSRQLTLLYLTARDRPWDDRVRCEIARLCLKLNRVGEARTMLRAAVASNPGNQEARQLLEKLGSSDDKVTR
jgi:tetratricopeptide (TPR) repeat protein